MRSADSYPAPRTPPGNNRFCCSIGACSRDPRRSWPCCSSVVRLSGSRRRLQRPRRRPRHRHRQPRRRDRRETPATRSPRASIPAAARSPATKSSPGGTPRIRRNDAPLPPLLQRLAQHRSTWMRERALGETPVRRSLPTVRLGLDRRHDHPHHRRRGRRRRSDESTVASSRRTTATPTTGR